jgi:hypothetical protein
MTPNQTLMLLVPLEGQVWLLFLQEQKNDIIIIILNWCGERLCLLIKVAVREREEEGGGQMPSSLKIVS